MADQHRLIARLERWLAEQPGPVTLADLLQTGDGELLGAYVLTLFRAAARRSVTDRGGREVPSADVEPDPSVDNNAALRIFDGLVRAWALSQAEHLTLLGIGSRRELAALRRMPMEELPISIIERLVMRLDIFHSINTLLSVPRRADEWIRAPNRAPQFAGHSALQVMLERDLAGMDMVGTYLRGQLAGP